MAADERPSATVADTLRVVPQFRGGETERLVAMLSPSLNQRLARYGANQVEMELSVKDRDTDKQRVVLEAWIAQGRRVKFVATSTEPDIDKAVMEVRGDMVTQINRHVTKREAKRNR